MTRVTAKGRVTENRSMGLMGNQLRLGLVLVLRRERIRDRKKEVRLPLVFGVLASMVFLGEERS